MPFAINESTRFISPTKTPEYLAAGSPVVSTPIADVVRHYGDAGPGRDRRDAAGVRRRAARRALRDHGPSAWLAGAVDRLAHDVLGPHVVGR